MKKRLLASLLSLCLIVGLLPTAALAVDEEPGGEAPVVCAGLEGCVGDAHDAECPLYAASDELDGDENTYYETDDVTDPAGPTAEETLAGMIADLPAPADIDPLDEEQVEAVDNQISKIYAFAEENGLDVEDNETINAVIAALYPAEPLEGNDEAPTSGNCGAPSEEGGEATDTVKWSFDATTGILTISGSGAMADYTESAAAPWFAQRENIAKSLLTTVSLRSARMHSIS